MKKIIYIFFITILSLNLQAAINFKPKKNSFTPKSSKLLFVSHQELPQSGYVGELVAIKIKAITPLEFEKIDIINSDKSTGEIKDLEPKWTSEGKNIYTKTIYFQAKKELKNLPSFDVDLLRKNGNHEYAKLKPEPIEIIKLTNDDGRFIGIFAKELSVKKFKTNRFDQTHLITVMELKTTQANLDDINFTQYKRQGFDSVSGKFPNNSLFYYVVLKEGTSELEFSYFNTTKNKFNIISLPIRIEPDDLSTQVGLNPKKSKLELYKEIAASVLCLLFLVLLILRKKILYGVLAVLFGGYLIYTKLLTNDIKLKEGAKIRILPTQNSTMFLTTKKLVKVEKLGSHDKYIKVLFDNGKIGWAEKEDVVKN